MALVGFCATPTIVLTSSICLHHLPDARRFGYARVWGAASWLLVLWGVSAYLEHSGGGPQGERLHVVFVLSAALVTALGLYALTLPNTPPARLGKGPLEALGALGMLKNRSFFAIIAVCTACGALFQVNLILQGLFFTSKTGLGLEPSVANRASSVSQVLELCLFPVLSALLFRFGTKPIALVGVLAWPLRFLVYLLGEPVSLVVGSQLLHGFNVVFGYFALQIAIDELAPRDLRASTHALLAAGGAGIGALSGQLASGVLLSRYGSPQGPQWRAVFAFPLGLGLLTALLLVWGFRPGRARRVRGW
jgi:MFS family permease